MSIFQPLLKEKAEPNPQPPPKYKNDMLRAIELLVSLGVMDAQTTDLVGSVKEVIKKLENDEAVLYGKKLNKQELQEELKTTSSNVSELKQELSDLEKKLADLDKETPKAQ